MKKHEAILALGLTALLGNEAMHSLHIKSADSRTDIIQPYNMSIPHPHNHSEPEAPYPYEKVIVADTSSSSTYLYIKPLK